MFCGSRETNNCNDKYKNEFGWWISETETVISSHHFIKRNIFENSNSFSNSDRDVEEDFNLTSDEDSCFSSKQIHDNDNNCMSENKEKMESIVNVDFDEIQQIENENNERKNAENSKNSFRKSYGFSYTPERLVKSKEYKILSPHFQFACIHSSKFRQKKLSELIDPNKIGGINLQKLLCPNIMPIKDYLHLNRYFNFHDVKNQIKEDSFSSFISNFKEVETLSEEKGKFSSSSEEENTSGIQSPGWSLDTSSDPPKTLLPKVENLKGSNEEDGSIFEDFEVESEISTNLLLDDRGNLSELQSKVRGLRNVNDEMQKDIETLKDDFQNDEWKVNILLEEAINFRREIQELQYLDNLVNLLRGELERISPKTWPFIRNHSNPYNEEINLII